VLPLHPTQGRRHLRPWSRTVNWGCGGDLLACTHMSPSCCPLDWSGCTQRCIQARQIQRPRSSRLPFCPHVWRGTWPTRTAVHGLSQASAPKLPVPASCRVYQCLVLIPRMRVGTVLLLGAFWCSSVGFARPCLFGALFVTLLSV
jgi:hypothetical protein